MVVPRRAVRCAAVDHYEVLGVPRTADATQIRRAYVQAARRNHPDFHGSSSPAVRRKAEADMRRINAAWAVLGDAGARASYDRQLRERARPAGRPAPTRAEREARERAEGLRRTASGASAAFRPLSPEDDVDPGDLDDTPFDGAEPPPRWMQMLPVALVAGGGAVLLLGFLISLRELVGLGLVGLALGAVAFLLAPFYVMSRGRSRR